MALKHVPTDSSNDRQHRTVIATTVNELVKVRPPFDKTKEEAEAGVTPLDTTYGPHDARRFGVRFDGNTDDEATNSAAIANAILAAREYGVQNGANPNRDQGVDIELPDGLIYLSEPIVLPRSGNPRANCIGLVGMGEATRLSPGPSFPADRAVIEWEATTSRLFHQRLKNFKIDLRTGLTGKAIWFKLNDPSTPVFGGEIYAQEEIKELDIDVMIHGDNESHEVLVDIEGKIKFSTIRITADLTPGNTPTFSTIILRTPSDFISSAGAAGTKADAVAGDNAGVNYSDVWIKGINSRGGNATCFVGRFSACNVFALVSVTGALGAASVVEMYGSSNSVFHRMFTEGRTENPQFYMEQCYYNTFLNVHFGSPDGSPSTGIQMVECEDNQFFNHSSATGKPSFSTNGGFLVDLDANCKRNKFYGFGGTAAFFNEVQDLGTDNYFEYVREDSGLVTHTHHRAGYSVGPFTQDNVAASQTDVALTGNRWIAPRAGRLTAVVVKSTEARTAGTLNVKVFKNTGLSGAAGSEVSASFRANLDGTNTSTKVTLAANEYAFAAGDEIYAVITTSAAWLPITADIRVWIEVQC